MYKHKAIERLIDKAHKEAAEAANKIYAQYQPQLIAMIQAQLHADDKLTVGMGSACVDRNGKNVNITGVDFFARVIAQTQYSDDSYSKGFNLPYTITKTEIKS